MKGKIVANDRNSGGLSDRDRKKFEAIVGADLQDLQHLDEGARGAVRQPAVRAGMLFAGGLIVLVAGLLVGLPLLSVGNVVGMVVAIAGFVLAVTLVNRGFTRVVAIRHPDRHFAHMGGPRGRRN